MIDRTLPPLPLPVRTGLGVLAALGLAAFALELARAPAHAWGSLLVSAFLFVEIAFGGAVLVALLFVSNAGWSAPVRRVPEALSTWLPWGALSILALLAGVRSLYPWAAPDAMDDPLLPAKHAYLNVPFFAARMAFVLVLWTAFAFAIRRSSIRQDDEGGVRRTRQSVVLSALLLVTGAVTFSMASFDWLMSLEPHWSSTIFGLYNLAGLLLAGVASTTVVVVVLRRRGLLPEAGESHVHDLGKLCFGLSTFWAYLWFSQYMLVWYANIPEEAVYFVARVRGGWSFLFWANLVLGWAIPFVTLLPRRAKRSEASVFRMAILLLAARWLDVYVMVGPALSPIHRGIGLVDVAVVLGLGGAFVLVVARTLARSRILPIGDPYLAEGLHHGG